MDYGYAHRGGCSSFDSFVSDAEALVRKADVVVSAATYLPEDVCADKYFEPGVLAVPIHPLGFTNCALFLIKFMRMIMDMFITSKILINFEILLRIFMNCLAI